MIRNFSKYLLEMSISDHRAMKYDTVLRELSDTKKTKMYISDLILELTDEFSNFNDIKFVEDENAEKLYLTPKYNANIEDIIRKLRNIVNENKEIYFKNVYPDGEEQDFYFGSKRYGIEVK